MPKVTISIAYEAKDLGRELIKDYHSHLKEARIGYLFTTKRRTKGRHVILGTTSKLVPVDRFLSQALEGEEGFDFIILFDANEWKSLSETQRLALVDHELCHCSNAGGDELPKWGLREHDIEEFTEVLARHGAYKPDVQRFIEAGQQLRLPFKEGFEKVATKVYASAASQPAEARSTPPGEK